MHPHIKSFYSSVDLRLRLSFVSKVYLFLVICLSCTSAILLRCYRRIQTACVEKTELPTKVSEKSRQTMHHNGPGTAEEVETVWTHGRSLEDSDVGNG